LTHAFEVVGHDSEGNFDLSASQASQQQGWMSEDAVLKLAEGMLDDAASESHLVRMAR
jgi:hypothetical protein